MAADARELVHQVNNLLSVIQTQRDVAEAVGTEKAAREALRMIAEAAERLAPEVRAFREARES